jgi:predicted lipoprotein with Yx(FWY)xxD motif
MTNHRRSWIHSGTSRDRSTAGNAGAVVVAAVMLGVLSAPVRASEIIPKAVRTQAPYPAAVSLVHESAGWTYRETKTGAPLYFNQKDSPGKPVCNRACETQWFPLLAQPDDRPTGDWTIFVRKDGRRQWAYRKRPVYTHIHDSADKPTGDGEDGVWHVMPHYPTPIYQP